MTRWAVLTGEYPPQAGGVSDYTRLVARGLAAAGDRVTVFAPPCGEPGESDTGVSVVRLPDHFGRRGRAAAAERLSRERPDRLLVQYVPHAFGMKAMNLPFTWWVASLRPIAPLWVTFHEVAFPYVRRPLKHNLLAWVTRRMARRVATAADRLFVTIPAWGELLRVIAPKGRAAEWLPVPSTLPTTADPHAVSGVRAGLPAGVVVGHFGTYGSMVADLLEPALRQVLRASDDRVALLLGRNGDTFRNGFVSRHPDLAGRVAATGALPAEATAAHLAACDVLVQPFPDGVSSRRTSAMAGLALGVPLVTNRGALTEPVWAEGGAVSLVAGVAELAERVSRVLADPQRQALGESARRWYAERFALERLVATLREGHGL
jgi:glycosyltransferase involved in cell wall biosynthesis